MENTFLKSKNYDGYSCSEKIEHQTVNINFHEEDLYDKIYYSVSFEIITKKKLSGNVDLKTTGEIGLLGLLWAKEKIIQFEKFIVNQVKVKNKKIFIIIRWSDNRRKKIYIRSLEPLGFEIMNMFGSMCLVKILFF